MAAGKHFACLETNSNQNNFKNKIEIRRVRDCHREGQKQNTQNVNGVNRCPGKDSKAAHLKYKWEEFRLEPPFSVKNLSNIDYYSHNFRTIKCVIASWMSTYSLIRLASNFSRDVQFYIYNIFIIDPNSWSAECGVYIINDTQDTTKPDTPYSLP
jgi:hypothetical protein